MSLITRGFASTTIVTRGIGPFAGGAIYREIARLYSKVVTLVELVSKI